jgi:single-stranded-DNA-specific exonuclease
MSKWKFPEKNQDLCLNISQGIECSCILADILINRGFTNKVEIENFLNPSLDNLYDPFLMKDMDKAVFRIKQTVQNKEKILIVGDFDADGVTASALLVQGLKLTGAEILYYIPDRIEEGYGFNEKAVFFAKENNVSLIITVDCGITANKEVEIAKSFNIDVIITDHHEPKDDIPNSYAILDPKQKDCNYPFSELAGVGVAYKLLQALELADDLLDIVVIGTIADIVPLVSENRVLVKFGLQELTRTNNLGLKSLINVTGLKEKNITAGDIGFVLAPRINAVGRLKHAVHGVKMLVTCNENEAYDIANMLDRENKERQKIEKKIVKQAIEKIEKEFDFSKDKIVVLNDDLWHAGVVGIVASRLVEKYYRPVVIISSEKEECKGSCRSIKGFSVFNALAQVKEHLIRFGGHEYAAGLAIEKNKINEFRIAINEFAKKDLAEDAFEKQISIDAEIKFANINFDLFYDLEKLAPFGAKNPYPVLCSKKINIINMPRIVGEEHVQIKVSTDNIQFSCIAFKMKHRIEELRSSFLNETPIDIAYTLLINKWQGKKTLQLNIKDFKVV